MNKKINSFYYLKKILILHEKRHCKHSFKKKAIMWEISVAYITEVNRLNMKTSPKLIRPVSQWQGGLRTLIRNSRNKICLVSE